MLKEAAIPKVFSILILLLTSLVSPLYAVDPVGLGENTFALLVRDSQTVEYRNAEGEILSQIALDRDLYSDEKYILPVPYQGGFAVLAIKTTGPRQFITATLLTSEGIVGAADLGPLKGSSLFAYDITSNGTFDLIQVGRRGQTSILYSPFTPQVVSQQFKVGKRKRDQVTITRHHGSPAIVVLRTKAGILRTPNARRLVRRAQIIPVTDPTQIDSYVMPPRTKGELIPLVSGNTLLEGEFLLHIARSRKSILGYINIPLRAIQRTEGPPGAIAVPGKYTSPGDLSQILLLESGNLTVREITQGFLPSSSIQLLDDSLPPQSDPSSPDTCSDIVPYSLIQQTIAAYHSGNWALFLTLQGSIPWDSLCEEASSETSQLLLSGLGLSFAYSGEESGALFASSDDFTLLGAPLISASEGSQSIPGCDVFRPASDGVNGFVYKTGEKDGKVAALLPSSIYTTTAWLTRLNGKNIERLKFDGRTNGWRATFRSKKTQRAYPKKLVVKAKVQAGFGDDKFYCWVLNNSHVRND